MAIEAFTRHAANAPVAKKIAISRGSDSSSGCGTKRFTSAAPSPACSAAPTPMRAGSATDASVRSRRVLNHRLIANEPSATAGSMPRPNTITKANAMPADGYSGDA